MKKILVIALLAALFIACNNNNEKKSTESSTEKNYDKRAEQDSLLITDSSWGLISAADNFESLKTKFGSTNLKDETICGAECIDSVDVTIVYPTTPREITIYWEDSAYHKKISLVKTYGPGSPYHTASGLRIGSSLRDVEKINGKKITFSGFGWDYGGGIISFNEGKLDKSPLGIELDLDEQTPDEGLYGDRELDTEMPLVKNKLDKIRIAGFYLSFSRN